MALSQMHKALIAKTCAVGNSDLAVPLNEDICNYLLATIISDLGLQENFLELPKYIKPFFGKGALSDLKIQGLPFLNLFERLINLRQDADSYFFCLATLHKARLKYEHILQAQPIPTIDQVGPRSLLQYGTLNPKALAAFLFWRKWIFDIDNRAGQETGYLFEPIIAHSIGGVPVGAKKSPIRRDGNGTGRQVDCIRETDKRAYEIKLRVTIAASGQGRWQEELDFPSDCLASGYTPVLVVLDPTPNTKLSELCSAFERANGEVYVGLVAWKHLEEKAGATMAAFLNNYVHIPINSLLKEAPEILPDVTFKMANGRLMVLIKDEVLSVERQETVTLTTGTDPVLDDLGE